MLYNYLSVLPCYLCDIFILLQLDQLTFSAELTEVTLTLGNCWCRQHFESPLSNFVWIIYFLEIQKSLDRFALTIQTTFEYNLNN